MKRISDSQRPMRSVYNTPQPERHDVMDNTDYRGHAYGSTNMPSGRVLPAFDTNAMPGSRNCPDSRSSMVFRRTMERRRIRMRQPGILACFESYLFQLSAHLLRRGYRWRRYPYVKFEAVENCMNASYGSLLACSLVNRQLRLIFLA